MANPADLPDWVLDMVNATIEYEEAHPRLMYRGEVYPCLGGSLLEMVPGDVLNLVKVLRRHGAADLATKWAASSSST